MVRGSHLLILGLLSCFLWFSLDAFVGERFGFRDRRPHRRAQRAPAAAPDALGTGASGPAESSTPRLAEQEMTAETGPVENGPVPGPSRPGESPEVAAAEGRGVPAPLAGSEPTPARPGESPAISLAESQGVPAPMESFPQAPAMPAEGPATVLPQLIVYHDYREAMQVAVEDRKMLFLSFCEPEALDAPEAFETEHLADLEIQEKLLRYVCVRLPHDAEIVVEGQPVKLLEHPAFAEMLRRPGVAIVDLAHTRAEYYGHVVSTFPFTRGKPYRKQELSVILDLPPGTLTQRTMIFAVRIHPERPASTQGQLNPVLTEEAKMHAKYQADILVQGHHSWDARFQRINSKLPSGVLAQEVVAESWPNESLVEACIDCVDSWRQSPGHWGAVRSRHPLFGYDIKRGRNGIWYATGIFGRR